MEILRVGAEIVHGDDRRTDRQGDIQKDSRT